MRTTLDTLTRSAGPQLQAAAAVGDFNKLAWQEWRDYTNPTQSMRWVNFHGEITPRDA